ncbi:hypothetical protein AAC387_Pa05g1219 [Persea americana]
MAETMNQTKPTKENQLNQNHHEKTDKPPSWATVRSIFTCKHHQKAEFLEEKRKRKCKKNGCSGSLCTMKDHKRVMHRPEPSSPEACKKGVPVGACNASTRSMKPPLNGVKRVVDPSSSSFGGAFRGMHLSRLSGCYECHMVVGPRTGATEDPSFRSTICSCPDCGEKFTKSESLELHQAVRHAVSELGTEDTSRNIVEIIFQSSWLKKQAPVCKIDRILKIHNTQKTITKFEDYRNTIKSKATNLSKKHPRCVADGNELLRFHCTTFVCSIGMNGSSSLCNSIPNCNVCSIIRNGFKTNGIKGIFTTATSGRAHDSARIPSEEEKRAMLVCRVIAGRVKKKQDLDAVDEFDSVAGLSGVYSNLDELFVFNPKAILPCFVVVYGGF